MDFAALLFSLDPDYGLAVTVAGFVVAVGINLPAMPAAPRIGSFFGRFNLMGAFIRITGLPAATIGVQMILSGLAAWHEAEIASEWATGPGW